MTPAELKSWRKRLGLTQAGAAAALGISRMQLSRYEHGRAEVPVTVALATEALAARVTDTPAASPGDGKEAHDGHKR